MKEEGVAVRFQRGGAPAGVRYDVKGPILMSGEVNFQKFAFYWVRLNEPDGSVWTVAQFIETKVEFWDYWNNRPSDVASPQNYWAMCGKAGAVRQIQKLGASNRWEIGGILTAPKP